MKFYYWYVLLTHNKALVFNKMLLYKFHDAICVIDFNFALHAIKLLYILDV